jgi:hypothetical protein
MWNKMLTIHYTHPGNQRARRNPLFAQQGCGVTVLTFYKAAVTYGNAGASRAASGN